MSEERADKRTAGVKPGVLEKTRRVMRALNPHPTILGYEWDVVQSSDKQGATVILCADPPMRADASEGAHPIARQIELRPEDLGRRFKRTVVSAVREANVSMREEQAKGSELFATKPELPRAYRSPRIAPQ